MIKEPSYQIICRWCFKTKTNPSTVKFTFKPRDIIKFSDANGVGKSSFFNTLESVVDKCCRNTNLCGYTVIDLYVSDENGETLFEFNYRHDASPPSIFKKYHKSLELDKIIGFNNRLYNTLNFGHDDDVRKLFLRDEDNILVIYVKLKKHLSEVKKTRQKLEDEFNIINLDMSRKNNFLEIDGEGIPKKLVSTLERLERTKLDSIKAYSGKTSLAQTRTELQRELDELDHFDSEKYRFFVEAKNFLSVHHQNKLDELKVDLEKKIINLERVVCAINGIDNNKVAELVEVLKWLEDNKEKYAKNIRLIEVRDNSNKYRDWPDRKRYEEALKTVEGKTDGTPNPNVTKKLPTKFTDYNTGISYALKFQANLEHDNIMIEEYKQDGDDLPRRTLREEFDNLQYTPQNVACAFDFIKVCAKSIPMLNEQRCCYFSDREEPDQTFHDEYTYKQNEVTPFYENICEIYKYLVANNKIDRISIIKFLEETYENFSALKTRIDVLNNDINIYRRYQTFLLNYDGPRSPPAKTRELILQELYQVNGEIDALDCRVKIYEREREELTREIIKLEGLFDQFNCSKNEFAKIKNKIEKTDKHARFVEECFNFVCERIAKIKEQHNFFIMFLNKCFERVFRQGIRIVRKTEDETKFFAICRDGNLDINTSLSGGERAVLNIATRFFFAKKNKDPIVVIDELWNPLDNYSARKNMMDWIDNNRSNIAIFVVDHNTMPEDEGWFTRDVKLD